MKTINSFITVAGTLICMAASPVLAQSVQLDDAEISARIETVLDRAMDQPEAVGLSVSVARDSEMLVETTLGLADLEFGNPADTETMFRIGSVTKQFTAAAIMTLVEDGALDLDSPLSDFLPDFDTGGRTITMRQLLNHTSGVPSYTSQPDFFPKGAPLDLNHEELLAFIADVSFDFEPGEGWNYSNTGYYLLGMVIEAVDGRTYAAFVQDELFEPLGLTRTRYGSARDIIPNRAQGYDPGPEGELMNDALINMNTPGAAGALISTAGDLVRWQMALTSGRAVSERSYQEMIDSSVPTGRGDSRYGFGLQISGTGEDRRISHGGGIPGFNSMLTLLPEQNLYVAAISNSPLSSAAIVDNILTSIMSEDPPPAPRIEPQPGAEATVRRMIGELAEGEPDYNLMSETLAEATRAQLPQLQQLFETLGPIVSITFDRVNLNNADVYDVQFENGAVSYMIALGEDGMTEMAAFSITTPPPQQQ